MTPDERAEIWVRILTNVAIASAFVAYVISINPTARTWIVQQVKEVRYVIWKWRLPKHLQEAIEVRGNLP